MKRIAGSVIAAAALALTGCQQDSVPTGPQPDAVLSAALASAQAGGRVFVVFAGAADPALVEQLGGQVVYSYHLVPAVAATGPGPVIPRPAAHPRVGSPRGAAGRVGRRWGGLPGGNGRPQPTAVRAMTRQPAPNGRRGAPWDAP